MASEPPTDKHWNRISEWAQATIKMNDVNSTPIVFIHGLIGSLSNTLGAFDPKRDLLFPSLLGYGPHANIEASSIGLSEQARHISEVISKRFLGRSVHVLGHSVGGAIAMLLAARQPAQVESVISVEGNFTLRDAFWSASVGRMTDVEATEMLDGFRADPAAWLARSGVEATSLNVKIASECLANQPPSTLRAMGMSVMETTGVPTYESTLRSVFSKTPVHLVAGERSRQGWDVPNWADQEAASSQVVAGTGHMMMLENPKAFAAAVESVLDR